MSYTFALSDNWDLQLDGAGGIKMLNGKKAVLQQVANVCRLFTDDALYQADQGIDWPSKAFGKKVQNALVKNDLRKAALSVPEVASVASIMLDSFDPVSRTLTGEMQVTMTDQENGSTTF